MRVIMFQERFSGMVLEGNKRQTIRLRARCKPGDVLSLRKWADKPYRSKHVILREEVCTEVLPVCIEDAAAFVCGDRFDRDVLARMDGFIDFEEMKEWFERVHELPFHGWAIRWGAPGIVKTPYDIAKELLDRPDLIQESGSSIDVDYSTYVELVRMVDRSLIGRCTLGLETIYGKRINITY